MLRWWLVVILVLALGSTSASSQCCGDCDGDGTVHVNELVNAVGNSLHGCTSAPAPPGALVRTGQTMCTGVNGMIIPCAGTGQDAELEKGLVRAFVDNGDGTITDSNTGLMWEKLSDDGSIHDRDDTYTWTDAVTIKVAALNDAAFAGHDDWRLPNRTELESLLNLGNAGLAIDAPFNIDCTPGCTVLTCSCALPGHYWSSTALNGNGYAAYTVAFDFGLVHGNLKSDPYHVRVVRGGV